MCQTIVRHCAHCGNTVNRTPSKKRNGDSCEKVFCSRDCYDQSRTEVIKLKGFNCATCGIYSEGKAGTNNKMFCSHNCRSLFVAKDAHKSCGICGVEFCAIKWRFSGEKPTYSKDKTKKLCSRECLSKFMEIDEDRKSKVSRSGSDHHNWCGGANNRGFRGHNWLKLAESVRVLAGRKCQHCCKSENDNGRKLDVNHIIPFFQWKNKTKANAKSNLEALCRSCHRISDAKWKKAHGVQMLINLV